MPELKPFEEKHGFRVSEISVENSIPPRIWKATHFALTIGHSAERAGIRTRLTHHEKRVCWLFEKVLEVEIVEPIGMPLATP